jgi:hypothetical protein
MKTPHPNPYSTVSVSREVYLQLLAVAGQTGFDKEDWEIAADAINDWVRRNSPDAIAMPATNGYQWKQLFLPNGTLLRTIFNGKNHHCLVEGDQILYEGRTVSPSGFVNAIGGIRRNAWKSLWILLPDTTTWKLADSLRTKKRPVRARKVLPPVGQAQNTAPSVPRQKNGPADQACAERAPDYFAITSNENLRGITRSPIRPDEIHPTGTGQMQDGTFASNEARREGGGERRAGDDEALVGLMQKAFHEFSRNFARSNHEAIAALRNQ